MDSVSDKVLEARDKSQYDTFVSYTQKRIANVTKTSATVLVGSDETSFVLDIRNKDVEQIKTNLNELFSHIEYDFIFKVGSQLKVTVKNLDLLSPLYIFFMWTYKRSVINAEGEYLLVFSDYNFPLISLVPDKSKIILFANGIAKRLELDLNKVPENKIEFLNTFFENILFSQEGDFPQFRKILNWKLQNSTTCR